jgi:hypothetical protein
LTNATSAGGSLVMRKEHLEMNRTKRHLWVLVLVMILLAIPTIVVFAKELGSLTVSGPGIDGEMTLDHEGGMMKLEQTGFFDQSLSIQPPENLGAGYNITAYLSLDGKIVPFVQMVYYATDSDEPGYVHYTARWAGESLQPVDQWRQLSKDADTAFRGLLEEYKIALQPAFVTVAEAAPVVKEPVVEPAIAGPSEKESAVKATVAGQEIAASTTTPTATAIPNQVIMALAVSFLVLLGAGLILRRRVESQRSPQV